MEGLILGILRYIKKMKLDLFWLDCTSDLRRFWT